MSRDGVGCGRALRGAVWWRIGCGLPVLVLSALLVAAVLRPSWSASWLGAPATTVWEGRQKMESGGLRRGSGSCYSAGLESGSVLILGIAAWLIVVAGCRLFSSFSLSGGVAGGGWRRRRGEGCSR